MMVILKIPIVYLCLVVYWAVKAEPEPRAPWAPRGRRPGPRRGPERTPVRARRATVSR